MPLFYVFNRYKLSNKTPATTVARFFSHSGMSRDAFQRSHYSIKGLTAKTDSIKIGGQIEAMVGIISRINLIKRRVAGVLY